MKNLLKIAFVLIAVVAMSSCTKQAPLTPKSEGPSFELRGSGGDDGKVKPDDDGGITDPGGDDDDESSAQSTRS